MKRLSFFLILIVAVNLNVQVAQDVAASAALKWFSQISGEITTPEQISKAQSFHHNNQTLFYSFSFKDGGFVLVSADKRTKPILGYSTTNDFISSNTGNAVELNSLPSSPVKELLTEYAEQINTIKLNKNITEHGEWDRITKGGTSVVHNSNDVEPLTDALWGQGYPYNIYCPLLSSGQRTVAHCGATAMAILLRHYKFPSHGLSSVSYSWQGQTLAADFSAATYDYDKMPTSLTNATEEEIHQVAQLSYHCGLAQYVNYGIPYSYSQYDWWNSIPDAFELYFGYERPLVKYKQAYSAADWEQLLINELSEGCPIFYWSDGSGGHFWVLDGYQEPGYFHMNWGWNGAGNGYFTLDNLVIGSIAFTSTQAAFINLRPNLSVSSVSDEQILPEDFQLKQNYPNPFNPTTTINYTIPSVGTRHVVSTKLTVTNLLGQVISTLVDKDQTPGIYNATFNASSFPSGVYFYTLVAGNFVQTKKLVLLK